MQDNRIDTGIDAALSRRRLLGLAGGAAAGLALGGPAAALARGARPQLESELNVLNWGSYIDFAIKPFEKRYGVKVNIEYYGDEDEAMAKVRANPGRYDTFDIGVGFLVPAVKQHLVQPLDRSKLTSMKMSYSGFRPGPFAVDGKVYGVCYAWGTNAFVYDKKTAPRPATHWSDFWSKTFKGRTALVDKPHDQYLATMLYLGLDFNHPRAKDWSKVQKAMIARAKNMRTLWSSGDDLKRFLAQGEVSLADCYDGLANQITPSRPSVVYVIPKEGTYGWYDGPELLRGAPHPEATYAWINFVTSPAMARDVATKVGYAPGNSGVARTLTVGMRKKLGLVNATTSIHKLKFWNSLGPEWDKKITDAWAQAKAS